MSMTQRRKRASTRKKPVTSPITASKQMTAKKQGITQKRDGPAKPSNGKKSRVSQDAPTKRKATSAAAPREKTGPRRVGKQVRVRVHLVSESTGGLAQHTVSVALSQFPKLKYTLHSHPFCVSPDDLRIVQQAIEEGDSPLVFSALAQPRLKRSFAKWCERRQIDHYDLMESLVKFVSERTGYRPIRDATRTHRCDDRYYKRMDAWEFTLQHDDSRRLDTVGQADIILLGVSRVGKTPLAAYLGSLGYRVANVSIAREANVPTQVIAHREKTIGLTVDPEKLAAIRKRRFELNQFREALRRLQGRDHSYYSERTVFEDVIFAEREFRRLGIHTVNMTELTVEESAVKILQLMGIDDESA
jgi:regulator of PEP synthase PpsR (kinase-PPPase family)